MCQRHVHLQSRSRTSSPAGDVRTCCRRAAGRHSPSCPCTMSRPAAARRLEDLLDDDPAVARRVGEHREVAARVGKGRQGGRSEAVDGAVPEERHEQRMGRREDDRVLDAHRHQARSRRRSVGSSGPPARANSTGDRPAPRRVRAAATSRYRAPGTVAVVPEHPLRPLGPTVRASTTSPLDGLADRPTEHGREHEDPVVLDVPPTSNHAAYGLSRPSCSSDQRAH